MKIFVDTNILVYANAENYVHKQDAVARLKKYEQDGVELWISRQVIREYLAVMSKLMMQSGTYDAKKIAEDVVNFQSQFFVADENVITTQNHLQLIEKYKVAGKAIHDCAITATMIQQGIKKIFTHNESDFERYAEEITVVPLIVKN